MNLTAQPGHGAAMLGCNQVVRSLLPKDVGQCLVRETGIEDGSWPFPFA